MILNRWKQSFWAGIFLLVFFPLSSAIGCEYCGSTSQVCTQYQNQCVSYSQQCTSYQQQCDYYYQQCDYYYQQCDYYEDVCDSYDVDGNCISSHSECGSYSNVCGSYSNVCGSYSDVCVSWQQVCDSYQDVCIAYQTQCDSYYYGDYVTFTGMVSNNTTGLPLKAASVKMTDNSGSSATNKVATDSNGLYSNTLFVYDDAQGKLKTTLCAFLDASDQQCTTTSVPDTCSGPHSRQDFHLNVTALPTPTGLVVTATSDTSLTASWASGGGLTNGYYLAYAQGAIAPGCLDAATSVDVGSSTSRVISGLSALTQYSVSVCAHDSHANPSTQISKSQTTLRSPPPVPTGVTANADSQSAISLYWSSGLGSTSTFKVNIVVGSSTTLSCTGGTSVGAATSYKFSGLTPSTLYTVGVCALDSGSLASSTVLLKVTTQATPPVAAPSNFKAVGGNAVVNLTWTDNANNELGFVVFRKTSATAWMQYASLGANTLSYQDTGVVNGTQYFYSLQAWNGSGISPIVSTAAQAGLTQCYDGSGFVIWQKNFGKTGVTGGFAVGDFNNDGNVDAADYTVWRDRFGSCVSPTVATPAIPAFNYCYINTATKFPVVAGSTHNANNSGSATFVVPIDAVYLYVTVNKVFVDDNNPKISVNGTSALNTVESNTKSAYTLSGLTWDWTTYFKKGNNAVTGTVYNKSGSAALDLYLGGGYMTFTNACGTNGVIYVSTGGK